MGRLISRLQAAGEAAARATLAEVYVTVVSFQGLTYTVEWDGAIVAGVPVVANLRVQIGARVRAIADGATLKAIVP